VDGPGPADLIASSYEDPGQIGYNQGRVYVFANSNTLTAVPPRRRLHASGSSARAPIRRETR